MSSNQQTGNKSNLSIFVRGVEYSGLTLDQRQEHIELILKTSIQSLNILLKDVLLGVLLLENYSTRNWVIDDLRTLKIFVDSKLIDIGLDNLTKEIEESETRAADLQKLFDDKFGKMPLDIQHPKYLRIRNTLQSDNQFRVQYYSRWTSFSKSVLAIASAYETNVREIVKLRINLGFAAKSIHLDGMLEEIQSLKDSIEPARDRLLASFSPTRIIVDRLDEEESEDKYDTYVEQEDLEQYAKDLIDGWIDSEDVSEEIKLFENAIKQLEEMGLQENKFREYVLFSARIEVGFRYEQINNYDKANQHFSEAMALTENPVYLYFWRGENNYLLKNYDQAKSDLLHALSLSESKTQDFVVERSKAEDLLGRMDN